MAKISRFGGPSSISADPGEIAENAEGLVSALHPDEQGALPLYGEGDESEWVGTNSSESTQKQQETDETNETDDQSPARTTENHSDKGREESFTAPSTDGGTKVSRSSTRK